MYMQKTFFFKTDEQRYLIAKHNLKCDFEVGTKTYFTKITNDDSIILLLVDKNNGTILQKWSLVNDVCVSSLIYESGETTVDCDSIDFEEGVTCADISKDNRIKCFLCEKNK